MNNIERTFEILSQLKKQGVSEYVVCAGARNAPLVKVLGATRGVTAHYFYDERAASFFALGRARRDQRPVAVVTTSGTAVAELLPATVEAFHSGVPLVLISADRPLEYRGSGAPQSIEQIGIFSHYALKSYDITGEIGELKLAPNGPTHLNVCYAEPLLDGEILPRDLTTVSARELPDNGTGAARVSARVSEFFARAKAPLVLLGAVANNERGQVAEFLKILKAPVVAEAHSGLGGCDELADFLLPRGDGFLSAAVRAGFFDSVLRIGSVPTARLWRDLEDKLASWPVLSVSEMPFSGLAREKEKAIPIAAFLQQTSSLEGVEMTGARDKVSPQLRELAKKYSELFKRALVSEPNSEVSFVHELSKVIPEKSLVMLGNSLPIREWDLSATDEDRGHKIVTQRGVNGIDGLIATFLGLAEEGRENWIVLGDLSALYDLNALSLPKTAAPLRVVVINNRGGRIFQPMFQDKNFINEHKLEFSHWAKMFDWEYAKVESSAALRTLRLSDRPTVIELLPDNEAGDRVRSRLREGLT